MIPPISITALASVSALGTSLESSWKSYLNDHTYITKKKSGKEIVSVAAITENAKQQIETLRKSSKKYQPLDPTVLIAIFVWRSAIKQSQWGQGDSFGFNIGSSRGATQSFEFQYKNYIEKKAVSAFASPTTTLGNISSWVGHDLQANGPTISHSITCSTSLHALLNGVVWLRSGMANKFMVGGSEASLSGFTIAQMKAMGIYSNRNKKIYPCLAGDFSKQENTMVLGEGASVACLEVGKKSNALALIKGIGYATEPLTHAISISTDAICFQQSMKMALKNTPLSEVDAIVMHAPGTVKGDISELKAIQKLFKGKTPRLTTNKWKIGHTMGASGMLSIELAILMLKHQQFIPTPSETNTDSKTTIRRVLVNAVGFGANAVSVLLSLD